MLKSSLFQIFWSLGISIRISKIQEKYYFKWNMIDNAKIALIAGFVTVVVLSIVLVVMR